MVPGFQKSWFSACVFHWNFVVDLADSKNQWVVLDADSDALIRFSIFTYLEVLFPPGSWRTFLVNKSMYAGPTGLKFSAKGQLLKENHMTIKFFRKSKILHFLGVKSEFYHCGNKNKFSVLWSKWPFLILRIKSGHVTYQIEAYWELGDFLIMFRGIYRPRQS